MRNAKISFLNLKDRIFVHAKKRYHCFSNSYCTASKNVTVNLGFVSFQRGDNLQIKQILSMLENRYHSFSTVIALFQKNDTNNPGYMFQREEYPTDKGILAQTTIYLIILTELLLFYKGMVLLVSKVNIIKDLQIYFFN